MEHSCLKFTTFLDQTPPAPNIPSMSVSLSGREEKILCISAFFLSEAKEMAMVGELGMDYSIARARSVATAVIIHSKWIISAYGSWVRGKEQTH